MVFRALFVVALLTVPAASGTAAENLPETSAKPPITTAAAAETSTKAHPAAGVPRPRPAVRPEKDPKRAAAKPAKPLPALADSGRELRASLMRGVRTWGIQLQEMDVPAARRANFDMFVIDAIAGVKGGQAMSAEEVAALKVKPDGSRRLLISYLSIGEAEDYRPDYFTAEYMTEDAPDWLLNENKQWKGNRLIRFCEEGWQRTILGDDDGRNVYNSVEPSPLYRLIEAGIDGVYLDRVDVYSEVAKECPDAARKMVEFVARLAAHARKKNPNFVVILQNAEELLRHAKMIATIDAVAKEDLFYGADHSERMNDQGMIKTVSENLVIARDAGKPVFVLDYLKDPAKRADDRARIEELGFIPYFGPRKLDHLWLSENGQ